MTILSKAKISSPCYLAQGQSVYVGKQLVTSEQLSAGFSFATCMAGAALTRTSFNLWALDGRRVESSLLTVHSFIGGLSGVGAGGQIVSSP